MTADSALTTYFSDGNITYDRTIKSFAFQGIGCVTTWGEMTHNRVGKYYYEQNISPDNHSINDLANITYHYLTNVYNPRDGDLEDVGYHIGGFDKAGIPRFFHLLWGFDRPRPLGQENPSYKYYDHSKWNFIYNGRNDIAHAAVMSLLQEAKTTENIRNLISTRDGAASFCDFVARVAADLTPEVGPPFYTYVISPDNSIESISNESLHPFNLEDSLRQRLEQRPIVLFTDDDPPNPRPFSLPTGVILNDLSLYFQYDEFDNLGISSNYLLACSNCGTNYFANGKELIMGTMPLCPTCRNEQHHQ